MNGVIVVITGPTCSGKSTLESVLVKEAGFTKIVSHTTRPIRFGEADELHYHFVTDEKFDALVREKKFVEFVEFSGHRYGASAVQFHKNLCGGRNVVIVAEPEGRNEILHFAADNDYHVIPVYVSCPASVVADRFVKRIFGDFAMSLAQLPKKDSTDKIIGSSAKRLTAILSKERHWEKAAHQNSMAMYRYDESNADFVLSQITLKVAQLQASLPTAA